MLPQTTSLLPAFDIPGFSAEVRAGRLFLVVLMLAVSACTVPLLLTRTVACHHSGKRCAREYVLSFVAITSVLVLFATLA